MNAVQPRTIRNLTYCALYPSDAPCYRGVMLPVGEDIGMAVQAALFGDGG